MTSTSSVNRSCRYGQYADYVDRWMPAGSGVDVRSMRTGQSQSCLQPLSTFGVAAMSSVPGSYSATRWNEHTMASMETDSCSSFGPFSHSSRSPHYSLRYVRSTSSSNWSNYAIEYQQYLGQPVPPPSCDSHDFQRQATTAVDDGNVGYWSSGFADPVPQLDVFDRTYETTGRHFVMSSPTQTAAELRPACRLQAQFNDCAQGVFAAVSTESGRASTYGCVEGYASPLSMRRQDWYDTAATRFYFGEHEVTNLHDIDSRANGGNCVFPLATNTTAWNRQPQQQQQQQQSSVAVADVVARACDAPLTLEPVATPIASSAPTVSQSVVVRRRKSKDALVPLVCQAIMSAADCRMALADICQFICERSADYRTSSTTWWQNSVRHTLSHYEFFVKAGRTPTGHGNFWTVHPVCRQRFGDGDYRIKRARHAVQIHEKNEASMKRDG